MQKTGSLLSSGCRGVSVKLACELNFSASSYLLGIPIPAKKWGQTIQKVRQNKLSGFVEQGGPGSSYNQAYGTLIAMDENKTHGFPLRKKILTLPETSSSPLENRPLKKEIPIGNHHF